MVLPGTFMPFFFPLGIAFMGSQSAVMMKMAGEQWQYGKRRISAMTNEEFNKLTPIKLFEIETSELRAMIPLMQESMRDMNKLTPIIVTEMIKMFSDFVTILYQKLTGETDNYLHPLFNMMLEFFGMPTKNIKGVDFDNTPDKFQPPGVPDVPFPIKEPPKDLLPPAPPEYVPPPPPDEDDAKFQVWLAQLTAVISPYLKQKNMHPVTWYKTYIITPFIVNNTS